MAASGQLVPAGPRSGGRLGVPRRFAPVLPVVLLIASLGLPVEQEGSFVAGAVGGGTPADALSALVVLYAALHALRYGRRPLTRTAAVVLGLPVAGLAAAAAGAADPATGLAGFARYAQVFVLVPAAVLLLIRDRADLRLVAWAFVGLAGWQGGLGVHQYLTGTGASYQGSDVRAVGTFGPTDVMGMATVVAYGVVCAVGLALAPGGPRKPTPSGPRKPARGDPRKPAPGGPCPGVPGGVPRWQRAVALGCALLLLVPLALSFSRGAWIATAVACGAQLALAGCRPSPRTCVALATAAAALAGGLAVTATLPGPAGPGQVLSGRSAAGRSMPAQSMLGRRLDSIVHVTDSPDQSVLDRYTMWAAALDMWRERPVTGVGLKGFPAHRDSHASLALSSGSDTDGAGASFRRQPLLSPHNMYLLVLAEQGLLGLTALAAGWAVLLVCGVRRSATERHARRGTRWGARVPASGSVRAAGPARGAECGLVGCGLLVWQLVDFGYADIGGPATVLTAVALGVAAWWSLSPAPDPATRTEGRTDGRADGRADGRTNGRADGQTVRWADGQTDSGQTDRWTDGRAGGSCARRYGTTPSAAGRSAAR